MFAYGIFKVIYSPFKAFKEIAENPKYAGPVLIMILFVVAYTGYGYTAISKTYVEQTMPTASDLDKWTENYTLWSSSYGVNISCSEDHIGDTYYGNKSVEFSIANSTQIWMRLDNIGSLNCSDPEGYKNMSFRIKWIHPSATSPNNASLYLYSSPNHFYCNLTGSFTQSINDAWNNLTISIGSESECWRSNNIAEADWSNITGLKFEFMWPTRSDLTVRIDGLFFRGVFKPFMESAGSAYLFNFPLVAFMQFTIKWVFLAGLLYVLVKVFGGKAVWKPLLTLAGFSLITLFMQTMVNVAAYATLPALHYPIEILGGVPGEAEAAFKPISEATQFVSQITSYIQIVVHMWTIALCAIAMRLLFEFSWMKNVLISSLAYVLSLLAMSFIMGY